MDVLTEYVCAKRSMLMTCIDPLAAQRFTEGFLRQKFTKYGSSALWYYVERYVF